MKYLGIDWGFKKIGLAISEGVLASPFGSLSVGSLNEAVEKVVEVAGKNDIDQLIIGKPEGEMGKKVVEAVKKLMGKGLVVKLVDETLSTKDAQRMMIELGYSRKTRRADDAVSAAIILQRFLDDEEK